MTKDLKIIKKKYGEEMMHFCRDTFASLLEEEGLLSNLLLEHFEPSHNLYNDILSSNLINDFKNYIYSLIENKNNGVTNIEKTPTELLDEAGYILYECESEIDIQNFRKYYAPGEELCTFRGGRLDKCYVFFAVKKDVDKIKRGDFKNPERQDLYGTSVISIQFTKDDSHKLSIKNRYNHRVVNPDATFSNNLDNIIIGLTKSFEKYYGLVQNSISYDFDIPNYVQLNNKYYKYNYELYNVYYCPNNIIIDNYELISYEKEKYLVFDYFLLDLQNKKIKIYDHQNIKDAFIDDLKDIQDVKIVNNNFEKIITIIPLKGTEIEIKLDQENNIISYKNSNIKEIGDSFLENNEKLKHIELPNVKKIANYFLYYNLELEEIKLPNVISIGDSFLVYNKIISKVELNKVKYIGYAFLHDNNVLKEICLSNVINIGSRFLYANEIIEHVYLPRVKTIKDEFLKKNNEIKNLVFPEVEIIGNNFLEFNNSLRTLSLLKVKQIGELFLGYNNSLRELYTPLLQTCANYFLRSNKSIIKYDFSNLKRINLSEFAKNPTFFNNPEINVYDIIEQNKKNKNIRSLIKKFYLHK